MPEDCRIERLTASAAIQRRDQSCQSLLHMGYGVRMEGGAPVNVMNKAEYVGAHGIYHL